jgi:hypothetical protein
VIEHRTTTGTHMHADGRECLFHATDQQWRIMHPIDAMRDCDRNHPEGMDNPIPEVEWFPPDERSCPKHPHWSGMSYNCVFCERGEPAFSSEQPCQAKDFSGETWCQREVVAGRDYCWSHLPFPPEKIGD